jgi:hypothetical protein
MGGSTEMLYEKAKIIVREELSKVKFEEHAVKAAENSLIPLLDSQITSCYAAMMAEQINKFNICREEIKRLKKDKEFFHQLNNSATQVHTKVEMRTLVNIESVKHTTS